MAVGGANAQVTDLSGGVFIAHYVPEIIASEPPEGWCGQYYALYQITDPSQQNTSVAADPHIWVGWYVLSAWCQPKQFCGAQFGIGPQVGDAYFVPDAIGTQACWPNVAIPSGLELPSPLWPGYNEGTALTSTSGPWDGNLLPVYLLTGYCYDYTANLDGGQVQLAVNAETGVGGWTNCEGVPQEFDPFAYGALGINDPGIDVYPDCGGPPEWACCFPDGSCSVMTEVACGDAAGVWYEGVGCDPNDCPQPEGACCFADGHCEFLTEVACADAGGNAWLGYGTDCDPNPCPPPEVACCFEDGSCVELTAEACTGQGGIPEPYPSDCDPNPCPQPTVCCVGTTCYIVHSEVECTDMGGDWYPDENSCDPNPCLPTPVDDTSWGSIKALYR
jgi:hypothetical protein